MKKLMKHVSAGILPIIGILVLTAFFAAKDAYTVKFPFASAGLSKQQAAAHLLSRFSYGATPGQIDEVANEGLEKWFTAQLNASLPDDSLNQTLKAYNALELSNAEVVKQYPKNGQLIRMAVKDGAVNKDSVKTDRKKYQAAIDEYMKKNGLKPERELFREFINQKILRAAYSSNQLQEVMTSFWFNHFNVSINKGNCAQFIPAYERDVIRPNALGKFSTLLLATAKAPAMLYYLDNFSSVGEKASGMTNQRPKRMSSDTAMMMAPPKKKNTRGLNENYAREVMELHTLGVDGGYTQHDVTEAARVLTGWTIYPLGQYADQAKKGVTGLSAEQLQKRGYVHDGDFLFAANRHDGGTKTVLGKQFKPNGYQEGVELLNMLAHHPSTAKFISRKLAIRFVSDAPPQTLIDKMAKTFLSTDGDIKQVLITMVNSREFWDKDAVREKTKSPFELAIGAVRGLDATITQPYQLYNWINKMGEKVYYYQAPTGFPDKGQFWINTGSLLSRMNFGLALTSGRIPGVKVNLKALNNNHEPESTKAALAIYCKLILPGRDPAATIKRLTPLLNDPELVEKVNNASAKVAPKATDALTGADSTIRRETKKQNGEAMQAGNGNSAMLAQVAGIIIGSPEYQRR
ncbi:DUF1800 domain-containing protein [Mucilaginibacter sp. UR6-1]|uniref:DUF1800 domain-containing protein n=1 Tax=Mucilaginibacter sp. UR6-1 TaxID=1435643 RepID=UPI001E601726|nr:DUF1800 domain-containing protein [Mucilaginibacter sp. UR6-1]MCC8410475.1 DUF1800 domain-containing protein [Mucilaginibacter sp. UR6-1]